MIGRGIAQSIEEATTAARMAPALCMHAFCVAAHIQEFSPLLIVKIGGLRGPYQMSLAAMGKLDFRSFTAVRTGYEKQRGDPQ
jgi:hypothetical protein